MLAGKLKYVFGNMIMFRGKLTVAPNTLNNQIHTFYLAHDWQEENLKEKKQIQKNLLDSKLCPKQKLTPATQQFTYENWIKLINDVAHFNRFFAQCYKPLKGGSNMNYMDFRAFRLFHDWDVWGDSTSFPQFQATGYFDETSDEPLKEIPDSQPLYLTSKMGQHKAIMAHQDTDCQTMGKFYGFTMIMDDKLKFNTKPFVNRQWYFKSVDSIAWSTSQAADWFGNGELQLLYSSVKPDTIKYPLSLLYKQGSENWLQLRMMQHRYNHPTKVSSVLGYIMADEGQNRVYACPTMNWRKVRVTGKYTNANDQAQYNGNINRETTVEVFLKQVVYGISKKQGLLIDLSSAILDANTKQYLPNYPKTLTLNINLGQKGEKIYPITLDVQLNKKMSGIFLITEAQAKTIPVLPKNQVPISLQIVQQVQSQLNKPPPTDPTIKIKLSGSEAPYDLEIIDRVVKTKRRDILPSQKDKDYKNDQIIPSYENYVQVQLFITSYGVPVDATLQFSIQTSYDVDKSGLTQYTDNKAYLNRVVTDDTGNNPPPENILTPKDRLKFLIKNSANFKNKYQSVEDIDNKIFQGKLQFLIDRTNAYLQRFHFDQQFGDLSYQYTDSKTPIELVFDQQTQQKSAELPVQKGKAKLKLYLAKDLTAQNNPRAPALQSICATGNLKIDFFGSKSNYVKSFTGIFFQIPSKDQNAFKYIDWMNVVGPKLRRMGLIYPSMQKIVDLYDFDGLSMSAMKRAFTIEDENHTRYMPATRQMSPIEHRQIRRWLYNPSFDLIFNHSGSLKKLTKPSVKFTSFDDGKAQLTQLLKSAFQIELTTIPLYLSALYTFTEQKQASHLIRLIAKDQMKHLFIVSNILNAIGQTPPYFSDKYIPKFPTTPPLVFQFSEDSQYKKLMSNIEIQPSIQEQLLRFIIIEMPSQVYLLEVDMQCKEINTQNKPDPFHLERKLRIQKVEKAIKAVGSEIKNSNSAKSKFKTIGMAYEMITDLMWSLHDLEDPSKDKKLFSGNPLKQFTYMYLENMTEVIDIRTALEQIRVICEEGEGSSLFNVLGDINKSSHFIKFLEIYTGCTVTIDSCYTKNSLGQPIRKAVFNFQPDQIRFSNFPQYTNVKEWKEETNKSVKSKVEDEMSKERLSDRLQYTQFPNTYAPYSFLNAFDKIIKELGFIFTHEPDKIAENDQLKGHEEIRQAIKHSQLSFQERRLKSMENAIAKMRQMTMHASHIIYPNDTYDKDNNDQKYPSTSPSYNLDESKRIKINSSNKK